MILLGDAKRIDPQNQKLCTMLASYFLVSDKMWKINWVRFWQLHVESIVDKLVKWTEVKSQNTANVMDLNFSFILLI